MGNRKSLEFGQNAITTGVEPSDLGVQNATNGGVDSNATEKSESKEVKITLEQILKIIEIADLNEEFSLIPEGREEDLGFNTPELGLLKRGITSYFSLLRKDEKQELNKKIFEYDNLIKQSEASGDIVKAMTLIQDRDKFIEDFQKGTTKKEKEAVKEALTSKIAEIMYNDLVKIVKELSEQSAQSYIPFFAEGVGFKLYNEETAEFQKLDYTFLNEERRSFIEELVGADVRDVYNKIFNKIKENYPQVETIKFKANNDGEENSAEGNDDSGQEQTEVEEISEKELQEIAEKKGKIRELIDGFDFRGVFTVGATYKKNHHEKTSEFEGSVKPAFESFINEIISISDGKVDLYQFESIMVNKIVDAICSRFDVAGYKKGEEIYYANRGTKFRIFKDIYSSDGTFHTVEYTYFGTKYAELMKEFNYLGRTDDVDGKVKRKLRGPLNMNDSL
ncbi:MAG: hypothetical protein N4A38_05100 [Candidatus Gracilibacteria bacterium]|nr:hypothetical protein [Candidatus Gracilibacteria bacterium]